MAHVPPASSHGADPATDDSPEPASGPDQSSGTPSADLGAESRPDDESSARDAMPSVLAVVVAHRPGPDFEVVLESIATQDYGRLSVLVVDSAGEADLDARVAAACPDAVVADASDTVGFSAAANAVLDTDVSAAYLLICHDDVALAPNAVTTMVVEALRSNAGVVGPKLVEWDEPRTLQHVGLAVDRLATSGERIEPGERDQEQHDAVRDVFAVPSACVLIRSDLFAALDGYDPAMTFRGEDVDLCWRAQLAGGRVVVVPDAVVRHREALSERRDVDDVRRTRARHSLRAMLVNHGRISLMLFVPVAALTAFAEVVIAALTGRARHVRDVVGAWTWNARRADQILARRKANRRVRRARPVDVTASQELTSVRASAFVRGQIGREARRGGILGGARRGLVSSWQTGTTRAALLAWVFVFAYVIYGSRTLIVDGVPAIGDFAAFPSRASDLIDAWSRGWRVRDLGAPGSIPGGVGLFGMLAWVLGGAVGAVRTASVLAPVVVGALGSWRVLAVTGSRRAQIGSLLAYVVIPLPYASIASASMAGLVGYAVAPWVLAALLKASAAPPFRLVSGPVWSLNTVVVSLGAAVGFGVAFEPSTVLVVAVTLVGLVIGGVLSGRPAGTVRMVAATVLAVVVAALLAAPMVLDVVLAEPSWAWMGDGRDGSPGPIGFGELIRFALGPVDRGPLTWGLGMPLVVVLLLARGWRFDLAVRCWSVALCAWTVAALSQWGHIPFGLPDPHLLVAPAAAAMAAAAGTAVAAVEHDLRFARFGWRQALVPLAVVGVLVGSVPSVGALVDGRWGMARGDLTASVGFGGSGDGSFGDGTYRVLWVGASEFLPVQGRSLDGSVAWAVTIDGFPTIADRWVSPDDGRADLVAGVLEDIVAGRTTRAGRLLGALGIQHVVLLDRLAPAPFSSVRQARPVAEAVRVGFADQLDLQRIDSANSAIELYRNTSSVPVRAAMTPGFDAGVDSLGDVERLPLIGGVAVLDGRGPDARGSVPGGAEVFVAQTPSAGWSMRLDGESVAHRRAAGWARSYLPASGGVIELSYEPPWWRRAALVVQVGAAVVIFGGWLRRRIGGVA